MPPRTSPRKKATATAVKAEKEVVQKVNGAASKAKAKVTKTEAATPKKKTAGKKRKAADDTEDEDDIGVNMASTATRAGRAIRKPARYQN